MRKILQEREEEEEEEEERGREEEIAILNIMSCIQANTSKRCTSHEMTSNM